MRVPNVLPPERADPRAIRSRAALQAALAELMRTKGFAQISVCDITDAAGLNRATFYDHYVDKFALLDGMVSARFDELLARRGVAFDGSCACALSATVLAVCDYLASVPWVETAERLQAQSHLEAAVIAVVRRTFLAGMRPGCPSDAAASPEMIATTAAWAIYGAAKEWLRDPGRCESGAVVGVIAGLVAPLLAPARWTHADGAALVDAAHR